MSCIQFASIDVNEIDENSGKHTLCIKENPERYDRTLICTWILKNYQVSKKTCKKYFDRIVDLANKMYVNAGIDLKIDGDFEKSAIVFMLGNSTHFNNCRSILLYTTYLVLNSIDENEIPKNRQVVIFSIYTRSATLYKNKEKLMTKYVLKTPVQNNMHKILYDTFTVSKPDLVKIVEKNISKYFENTDFNMKNVSIDKDMNILVPHKVSDSIEFEMHLINAIQSILNQLYDREGMIDEFLNQYRIPYMIGEKFVRIGRYLDREKSGYFTTIIYGTMFSLTNLIDLFKNLSKETIEKEHINVFGYELSENAIIKSLISAEDIMNVFQDQEKKAIQFLKKLDELNAE